MASVITANSGGLFFTADNSSNIQLEGNVVVNSSFSTNSVANLGAVGNVIITGGSNGQVLTTNGSGNLSWTTVSGGGSSNISNGTSIVNIPVADGNVVISRGGTKNTVFSSTQIFTEHSRIYFNNSTAASNYIAFATDLVQLVPNNTIMLDLRSSDNNVAIGNGASAAANGIAIGTSSASQVEGNSVAIGYGATGRDNSIAIGPNAKVGWKYSIAIGSTARTDNSANSIAIGTQAGGTGTANNTIVLNASGAQVIANTANTFVVKPIRQANTSNVLYYNSTTGEISFDVSSGGGGGGSNISNGTSNVSIATSGGDVTTSVAGNANILVVTGTGANITGTLQVTGNTRFGSGSGALQVGNNTRLNTSSNPNTYYTQASDYHAMYQNNALGFFIGNFGASGNITALGPNTGGTSAQGVSIGANAYVDSLDPDTFQRVPAMAIGANSYAVAKAIAIGSNARSTSTNHQLQVMLGFNARAGANNTMVFNATGTDLYANTANSFVVKPIRQANTSNVLYYNSTTGEISFDVSSGGGGGGSNIANGNSNISISTAAGNIDFSVNGTANVFQVADGGNLVGNLIKAYSNGQLQLGLSTSATAANAIAIGRSSIGGNTNTIAIGVNANANGFQSTSVGDTTTAGGNRSTAVGFSAGAIGGNSVAIGSLAKAQGNYSVTIGFFAGFLGNSDATQSVTIGANAGYSCKTSGMVLLGSNAARGMQTANGGNSVVIGTQAASDGASTDTESGNSIIAIGYQAAQRALPNDSIAIGSNVAWAAGRGPGNASFAANQSNLIALGWQAAIKSDGQYMVAIGANAGYFANSNSVSIGYFSGANAANNSISIGVNAGAGNIGSNSIAIGANAGTGAAVANNAIILNATGANLQATTANTLTIAPVRAVTDVTGFKVMYYNPTTKEVVYYNV